MPAQSDHTGSDAARGTRPPGLPARSAGQAQPRLSASDPDDAKIAPQPSIKIRPVQPLRPSPVVTAQAGNSKPATTTQAGTSESATSLAGTSKPAATSQAGTSKAATQAGNSKPATTQAGTSKPAATTQAGTSQAATQAATTQAGTSEAATSQAGNSKPATSQAGSSNGVPSPVTPSPVGSARPAQPAPPPTASPDSPQRPASSLSQRISADPDDAKTAPQPAIRIRPASEAWPVQARRASGPSDHDQHGFVPGMARPNVPYRTAPRTQKKQPSWPTILATTVRLWLQRRARGTRAARDRAVSWQWIRVTALVLVILAAAGLGIVLSRSSPKVAKRPGPANPVLTAQSARSQAAAWISQQAGRNTIVSCDPAMCSALLARGFPAGNLDTLRPDAPDPLASDLVAATSVLRSQFGPRLRSVYAPVVLARFGTGSAEVDIRVVAPDGAAAYTSDFRADLAARKTVGAQLLRNSKVEVDPPARHQLASGVVDSRLLVTLATMADTLHPLHIVGFVGTAPGASPGTPLRTAVVSGAATGPTGRAAVLRSLRGFLQAQQPPYLPASTQIVPVAAGQSVLRIQFGAPSPLGLLSAGPPVVKVPSR